MAIGGQRPRGGTTTRLRNMILEVMEQKTIISGLFAPKVLKSVLVLWLPSLTISPSKLAYQDSQNRNPVQCLKRKFFFLFGQLFFSDNPKKKFLKQKSSIMSERKFFFLFGQLFPLTIPLGQLALSDSQNRNPVQCLKRKFFFLFGQLFPF